MPDAAIPTELRSSLGLAGYFGRSAKGLPEISSALYLSLSAGKSLIWTEETEEALQSVKLELHTPPDLTFPDLRSPFIVKTDASSFFLGARAGPEERKMHGSASAACQHDRD